MKRNRNYLLPITVLVAGAVVLNSFAAFAEETLTGEQALEKLLVGNQRYVTNAPAHPNQNPSRRAEVAKGQKPFAIILACADSRVAPEVIFDQGLGDLFVVRVAGNVVDNASLGSLEYAAEHLGTSLLVVLGHERCGAVQAAVNGGHTAGHIYSVVEAIEPAVRQTHNQAGDPVENAVRANVQRVVKQLQSSEPLLGELQKAGKLKIVGARYDLNSGEVTLVP